MPSVLSDSGCRGYIKADQTAEQGWTVDYVVFERNLLPRAGHTRTEVWLVSSGTRDEGELGRGGERRLS